MDDFRKAVRQGIPEKMPPPAVPSPDVSHAPVRPDVLTPPERVRAVTNALRSSLPTMPIVGRRTETPQ